MKAQYKIFLLAMLVLAVSSCKKYLDQIPDDTLTVEGVFDNSDNALRFLANVYSNVPDEFNQRYVGGNSNAGAWTAASDEADYQWNWVGSNYMNIGSWNSSSSFVQEFWQDDYNAIRSATFFMQNIDKVPSINMPDNLKVIYKNEARALRAIYYFYLVRIYGPIVIIGDEPIAVDAPTDLVQVPRNSMDECIDYITKELDSAANNLPVVQAKTTDYGRITKPIALAFKARALLLNASPLFNGNSDYAALKNLDGKQLINQTYDANKWKLAADAYKEFLNQFVPGTFDLYKESDANGFNPYLSCRNVLLNNWNKEVIFVRPSASVNNMQYDRTPYHNGYASGVKASGALGATQVMVDAFSMANGKLISDPSSGYVTTGYSSFKAPGDDQARNIFNQWVNREPRFYVNITYDGSKWLNTSTSGTVITQLYAHGNSGAAVNNEASRTGYIVRKNVGTSDWNSGGIINVQYRLANIFLDYVEALNESDPGNADILNYLNQIRARAGVPEYGSGLPAPSSQTEMRQAIRHERQVELCFENVRYFDTRRWKIAEQTDNGVFYGLNINADLPDFLKQVPFETRVFTKRDYLFPIPQYDINNDPNLVQNTGWGK